MHRRTEYDRLLTEMYTVYVESSLASPLAGSVAIEVNPRGTVRDVIYNFLYTLQNEDGIPGLAVFDKDYNKLDWDATVESQGVEEGSKLYIGYDRTSLFRPVYITVVGVCTVIIAAVLFIAASALYGATGGDVPFDFGIVIDAGSTHTEVYLYQWSGSKYHGTGWVNQKDFCNYDEGIAAGSDPINIVLCVNKVVQSIPQGSSQPILFLGATAGMRILNMSTPKDVDLILMTLRYALSTSHVQVKFVGIIQGEDEGIDSWITTNFLSGSLNQSEVGNTYGALDLGGASTQFTYALDPARHENVSNAKILKLYGNNFSVVSQSFLCFGASQAMYRSDAVIFMNNWNTTIIDPCKPKGSFDTLTPAFLENPCLQNENITSWRKKHVAENENLTIIGTGDYEGCSQIVSKLVNKNSCMDMGFKQCLEANNLAERNMKFMAFSSFYYTVSYLNGTTSLEQFVNSIKNWCNLTYDEIFHHAHNKSEFDIIVTYCFRAVYITELLTKIYGFNSSTWKNILFVKEVRDVDVGWSLGYMINATNAIPEELPSPPVIKLGVFAALLIISVFMIVAAVVLLRKSFSNHCKRDRERLLEP